MSCNNLKAPTPPSLDKLPDGINLPKGVSMDSIKSQASGKVNSAVAGAGDLVSSNLKKLGSALSPEAIADRVGEAINGIANTITDTITGTLNSITSLKDRLKSFDPSSAFDKVPGSPGQVSASVKSKLSGVSEFKGLQGSISSQKCGNKFVKQASQANKGIKESAAAAIQNTSAKDRAKAVSDPAVADKIKSQANEQVKQDITTQATTTATAPDKESRSAQEETQSEVLQTVTTVDDTCAKFIAGHWYDSYHYLVNALYYMNPYGIADPFEKFGFLGIQSQDIVNVCITVKHVADEYVACKLAADFLQSKWNEYDGKCEGWIKWEDLDIRSTKIPGTGVLNMLSDEEMTAQEMISNWWDFAVAGNGDNKYAIAQYGFTTKITGDQILNAYQRFYQSKSTSRVKWSEIKPRLLTVSGDSYGLLDGPGQSIFLSDMETHASNFKKVVDKKYDSIIQLLNREKRNVAARMEVLNNTEAFNFVMNEMDTGSVIAPSRGTTGLNVSTVYYKMDINWNTLAINSIQNIPSTEGVKL